MESVQAPVEIDDFQLDRYIHRYRRLRQAHQALEQQKAAYQESLDEPEGGIPKTPKAILSLAQWRTIRQEADLDTGWRQQTEQEISRLGTRQERLGALGQRVLRRLANLGMPVGVYVDLPHPSPAGPESVLLLRDEDSVAGGVASDSEDNRQEPGEPKEPRYTLRRVLTEAIEKAPAEASHSKIQEVSDEIEDYRSGTLLRKLFVWTEPLPDFVFYSLVLLASWGALVAGLDTLALWSSTSSWADTSVTLSTWTPLDAAFRDLLAGPMGSVIPTETDLLTPFAVMQEMMSTIMVWGFFVLAPAAWFLGALLKLLILPFTTIKHLHATHQRVAVSPITKNNLERHVGPNT